MALPGVSETELRQLQQLSLAYAGASQTGDFATAGRLTSLARTYPNISPGLAYALAVSGQGPGAAAREAWQTELQTTMRQQHPMRNIWNIERDNRLNRNPQFRRRVRAQLDQLPLAELQTLKAREDDRVGATTESILRNEVYGSIARRYAHRPDGELRTALRTAGFKNINVAVAT